MSVTTLQTAETQALAPVSPIAPGSLADLSADCSDALRSALAASVSPNTRAAYRSAWSRWTAWAAAREVSPLPATPKSVAEHLAELAESKSVATVKLARAAISKAHRLVGQSNPTTHEVVCQALEGIERERKVAGRGQAKPLTADDLAAIQATASQPRDLGAGRREVDSAAKLRGLEDSAMAGLLFQAALRRSEVASLEWRDIAEAPSGSPCEGLLITVRESKTDQTGQASDVRFVKNGTAAALRSLKDAREAEGRAADSDPIFGLTPRSIGNRFSAACEAAGIGKRTAHSGRVGHASHATLLGAPMQSVMRSGGWKSERMVAHYSAGSEAAQGTVARYF